MYQNLNQILNTYSSININNIRAYNLLDRLDTKYIFNINQLENILIQLKPFYDCFVINGNLISKYNTLYYDYKDLNFYYQHHNGKLNRYKVRYRNYVESNIGFMEIKLKTNKNRTIKTRLQSLLNDKFSHEQNNFFSQNKIENPNKLKPQIWINYSRICLVSKSGVERVTLDINYEANYLKTNVTLNNIIFAEVKRIEKNNSPFINLVRSLNITEVGISKYCLGMALTNRSIKTNNFKENLRIINKI